MDALAPPARTAPIQAPRAADRGPEAMRAAATRFEAQSLGALLQPLMGEAAAGPFSGGAAEAQWRPMMTEQYAKSWAARGGVGLANAVFAEMLRMQGAADGGTDARGHGSAGGAQQQGAPA